MVKRRPAWADVGSATRDARRDPAERRKGGRRPYTVSEVVLLTLTVAHALPWLGVWATSVFDDDALGTALLGIVALAISSVLICPLVLCWFSTWSDMACACTWPRGALCCPLSSPGCTPT